MKTDIILFKCRTTSFIIICVILIFSGNFMSLAGPLRAGVSKVSITNTESGLPVHDSLYVKALVLDNGDTKAVLISVDAVTLGYLGTIKEDYLNNVRSRIEKELKITPGNVMICPTHLHGAGYNVTGDILERTMKAVRQASKNMVEVKPGSGSGYEDRIAENRRLRLKNGVDWDIRHAYPMPPDDQVVSAGPMDPEIGILRLDKNNGDPLAILFNYACHPYQGVSDKSITGDFPGIASRVIEEGFKNKPMAIFIQGCGGDISTVLYKDVNNPRDAEPLGNMLGLSTLKAVRGINSKPDKHLNVIDEIIQLPRRTDLQSRISSLETEQERLLKSLRGTSLNVKTFLPLYINYNINPEFPSYYSHRYLNDRKNDRNDLENLDAENRRNIDKYLRNIYSMESLARIQENLSLLRHMKELNDEAGNRPIDVEIQAMRIGDFVLVSFPAEVSVEVGLNIKKASPFEATYIAAFTNGYLYYAPTADQIKRGDAQEDAECFLAPEWQKIYEDKIMEILKRI